MPARSGKLAENRTLKEQLVLSEFILSGVEVVEGQFHESDSFGHKKHQNDRIIDYFSIFLCVLYLIRITKHAIRHTLYENRVSGIEQRFMQNKANSLNVQTSVNNYLTGTYENKRFFSRGKNKANQSQTKPIYTE